MMRQKTIERIVREYVGKELSIVPDTLLPEQNLVNDLHADSMDIVNIVTALEGRFKIKFPDSSQIQYNAYTIQFLVDGITAALSEKSPVRKARTAVAKKTTTRAKATAKTAPKAKSATAKKPAPKSPSKPKE